ncbi:hypothetical protein [Paeniglutamicibacter sp. Y32M11]|uniref:hypothetical protein n=1 Tax=Paeniglutamicibacter sp. Y32M11 TaxID=2853258 RepID=UPI001C529C6A|nr:hypothetical protein [Paeniglutamicibacter sp. Y32M11]QXQ11415.1 hypothetical protein KUF55_05850 [Paeniglutamicibacter sp. Y32M11]
MASSKRAIVVGAIVLVLLLLLIVVGIIVGGLGALNASSTVASGSNAHGEAREALATTGR